MIAQSQPWYIRGEGDQPVGPYTGEQLIEACREGRVHPSTICCARGCRSGCRSRRSSRSPQRFVA